MYKILFIDEQKDDIDSFLDYVDDTNTSHEFQVLNEFPAETLEEMLQIIFKHSPDAVITDFMLNEYKDSIKYNVPYNGVQLVQEVLAIREGLPCFVLTSFDDNAVKESEDVNMVYIKEILHGFEKDKHVKANFLQRVESQINHYKAKIKQNEERLLELIELKKTGKATLDNEKEMIHLDHLLELAIDKRSSIPEEYKELSNTDRLEKILNKVDELLKKVENKDGK